jgi:hypothetical protein
MIPVAMPMTPRHRVGDTTACQTRHPRPPALFPVCSRASGDADPLPAALKITIRERMGIDRLDVNEHTDLTPT